MTVSWKFMVRYTLQKKSNCSCSCVIFDFRSKQEQIVMTWWNIIYAWDAQCEVFVVWLLQLLSTACRIIVATTQTRKWFLCDRRCGPVSMDLYFPCFVFDSNGEIKLYHCRVCIWWVLCSTATTAQYTLFTSLISLV